MSKSLGKQALVEFYRCDPVILNDAVALEKIMLKASEIAGITVIKSFFHAFSPHGITGMLIITESHFSIHTWPEYGFAAVDLFTCGNFTDNIKSMDFMKEQLVSGHYSIMEISRGVMDIQSMKQAQGAHRYAVNGTDNQ